MTATLAERPPQLWHPALFYAGDAEYVAGVLDFVREGLERAEPALVAVPEPNLSTLRAAMSPAEHHDVETADMGRAGRNPGRIIGGVLTAFVRRHAGRRVRIVGEPIWAARSEEEYPACAEHEALINVALHDAPASILCPYDTAALSPQRLLDATRTHPVLIEGPHRWHSQAYTDPAALAATFDRPLPSPPLEADIQVIGADGPRAARRLVHDVAGRTALSPARVADLRAAVQELVVNTLVHAGGQGLLSAWTTGEHVVCQVEDRGWLPDVLAGRRPPDPPDVGHGLYLVHQLADLVRVHRDHCGTTVRVHFALDGPG
ncbi:MAG: anti-sigma factor RsbA family regulatory protein [Pseudonocardia sp.]